MLTHKSRIDVGLLVLRILAGGTLFFGHGLGKITRIPGIFERFPDPIGLGSTPSALLAIFAEVACAIAVVLGVFTRLAAIPVVITMLVAFFVVHAGDPFKSKELALIYLGMYGVLVITGGGRLVLGTGLLKPKEND